ncbi:MAG: hypothetical protein C1943_06540 [Halochromatium sp.]|nr:hypothetical protein [Halochromatium sp.]
MINREMLQYLGCPNCSGAPLTLVSEQEQEQDGCILEGRLHCSQGHEFPIRAGIPLLLAQGVVQGDEWETWQRHLEGFRQRRERRQQEPVQVTHRLGRSEVQQQDFAAFTEIQHGRILDVGCGPGKFRQCFDPERVAYIGLDPITLPETGEFPFAVGLAEYLPFQDEAFSDVTVLAALDHFNDKEAFFREVVRVLAPDGRFHLLQSIHETKGLKGRLKHLAHEAKDFMEAKLGGANPEGVPEHMTEFGFDELMELMRTFFRVEKEQSYDVRLLAPTRMFLSMRKP